MSSPRSIPPARSCRISSSSRTTPRTPTGGPTCGRRRRWSCARRMPRSMPIPCSPTISPRSSTTRRTRSAATTPFQEARTDAGLYIRAKHHRETVFLDLLLGHAPAEHEARRQALAEIAPPEGQQDAGGIVGRLLARPRRELDLLVIPDVLVARAEVRFRIAAAVGELLQQVPLLGGLLRSVHRAAAEAVFRVSILIALRREVTQRAGQPPFAEGRDVGQVRRGEGTFR